MNKLLDSLPHMLTLHYTNEKKVIIYLLTLSLCHSERSEESRYHKVGVTEILPPFGRLTS
jgi:hypothetical protein